MPEPGKNYQDRTCEVEPLLDFTLCDRGEQQRRQLSQVLLTEPRLLLLDSLKVWTVTLRRRLAQILKKLKAQGMQW